MRKVGQALAQNPEVPIAAWAVAEGAATDRGLFALVASHRGARAAGFPEPVRAAPGERATGMEFLAQLGSGPLRITSAVIADLPGIAGAVVLSTCNRFEVYCETAPGARPETARENVLSVISMCSAVPRHELSQSFDALTGPAMTEHLFSVGAGLDSAVIGEREIAGQLRRSLASAQESGTASGALVRLFQGASRAARDVGALTTLGDAGRSMVSVALDLATARLGIGPRPDLDQTGGGQAAGDQGRRNQAGRGLAGLSVVVIGTGAYAGSTMALLAAGQCTRVSVFSWSGRAEAFAASRGAAALTRDNLQAAILNADVVIGCSGRGPRLGADDFRAFRQGATADLVVVDLALSRDFEPGAGELPGVELISLEDVRLASPPEHTDVVRQAKELIRQAAVKFEEDQQARLMDPAIVALRGHMQQVLAGEIARVKNEHGCTATAEAVEFALRRVVRQLLHVPTARARELAAAGRQDDYTAALEALYGLNVEAGVLQYAGPGDVDAPAGTRDGAGSICPGQGEGREEPFLTLPAAS
jgi:glutamyl-tRNA reductase